jgi:hypothetical protein
MQANKDGNEITEVAAATNMSEGNKTTIQSEKTSHQVV